MSRTPLKKLTHATEMVIKKGICCMENIFVLTSSLSSTCQGKLQTISWGYSHLDQNWFWGTNQKLHIALPSVCCQAFTVQLVHFFWCNKWINHNRAKMGTIVGWFVKNFFFCEMTKWRFLTKIGWSLEFDSER